MVVVFVNYVDETIRQPCSDMGVNRMSGEGYMDGETHVGRGCVVGVWSVLYEHNHHPSPDMGVDVKSKR